MLVTFDLSLFIRKLSLSQSFSSSILSSLNLSLLITNNKKTHLYTYIFLLFPHLLFFSLSLSLPLSLSSNDVCNSSLLPPPLVVAYSVRKKYDISSLSLSLSLSLQLIYLYFTRDPERCARGNLRTEICARKAAHEECCARNDTHGNLHTKKLAHGKKRTDALSTEY